MFKWLLSLSCLSIESWSRIRIYVTTLDTFRIREWWRHKLTLLTPWPDHGNSLFRYLVLSGDVCMDCKVEAPHSLICMHRDNILHCKWSKYVQVAILIFYWGPEWYKFKNNIYRFYKSLGSAQYLSEHAPTFELKKRNCPPFQMAQKKSMPPPPHHFVLKISKNFQNFPKKSPCPPPQITGVKKPSLPPNTCVKVLARCMFR